MFTLALILAAGPPDFAVEVRPLLSEKCYRCHGPDTASRKADLRLDRPGWDAAEVLKRIASDDPDEVMPPPKAGKLEAAQKNTLTAWIKAGGTYAKHWSHVPPVASPVPAGIHPVDYFIRKRLAKENLEPAPLADRYTLARRVMLDLTGLPPKWEQVTKFVADESPDAYEKFVDRVLAAPGYGEHWARQWLDLARYADSAGYADDPPRVIWAYRDWVIRAFDGNMPFDRFTVEQVAGDLLPNPTPDQLVATAFHRNTMTNNEGGTSDEEFRNVAVADRVDTTLTVWMGTTAGCARCHDHKYDPFSQADYFRVFAVFNTSADADRRDESPTIRIPGGDPSFGPPKPTEVPVMQELPAKKSRVTRVHVRGNWQDLGDVVQPGVPAAFPTPKGKVDRLAFARWLVSRENPLTARVTVNRYWETLFGTGLVRTTEEFGNQGDLPSHPELLDWLAVEFSRSGWDTKKLLKLLVTSHAYRQDSRVPPGMAERDPDNRLLARGPRVRHTAEMVRDQALMVGGLLSAKKFGPSVRPPQPNAGLSAAFGRSMDWSASTGEDRYRRGLYTEWRRSNPYVSMAAFDAPNRDVCVVRRPRSNTPLQALVTLNDPTYLEAARGFAKRILAEKGSDAERAGWAVKQCLSRPATPAEAARLAELVGDSRKEFSAKPDAAKKFAGDAETAAWTAAATVLLNLDESVFKR